MHNPKCFIKTIYFQGCYFMKWTVTNLYVFVGVVLAIAVNIIEGKKTLNCRYKFASQNAALVFPTFPLAI